MFQLIEDVLESKRKNIPDTPNYIFYRRLLLAIIVGPMLIVGAVTFMAFIHTALAPGGLGDIHNPMLKKGILASGLDFNTWGLMCLIFDTLFVIGAIFWLIKPRTEAGIKKALLWLNFAMGIVGILIGYAVNVITRWR